MRIAPQLLFLKGRDSLFCSVGSSSFPDDNFSFDFPFFWISQYVFENESSHQLIKRYDANKHSIAEFAFKLPDQSGFADYNMPASHDANHVWYHHNRSGLYAFDKRDYRVYKYPLPVKGDWAFVGVDSLLMYFCNPGEGLLLAVNKAWLDKKKNPFDAKLAQQELQIFGRFLDSLQMEHIPGLAGFVQGYTALQRVFGHSSNASIQAELKNLPFLLKRRSFNEIEFARSAAAQFPLLEKQIPKALLPPICEGQMAYCIQRGDLDAFMVFYEKIQQADPEYFDNEANDLALYCLDKAVEAHGAWKRVEENTPDPDAQLWEKGTIMLQLFIDETCNARIDRNGIDPAVYRLPAAYVYADLSRAYPDSRFSAMATCLVIAWREEGTEFPLEIWQGLSLVKNSDCASYVQKELKAVRGN